jgi:methionyl-tRNA formyltransferase
MSKELRIIFYGTPEFATGVLKTLHESQHHIVAVVTAADKPAGRGMHLQQSDVKRYADVQGIPVLQPANLKDDGFIEILKSYRADLQVIVAFRMLPKSVWSMPSLGTFNLHASLLPRYRGAAPINWAIINGDTETGVTTFFIDDKIDTGAIIDQSRCAIRKDEDVGTLYTALMALGSALTLRTVQTIATGRITTIAQSSGSDVTQAPKLTNENTTINWNTPARRVDAFVRGLYPFPIAKATLIQKQTATIKIFKTVVVTKNHKMEPGSIVIDGGNILIACAVDFINILELQLPSKKRMKAKDLLNGFSFDPDARFDVASLKTV